MKIMLVQGHPYEKSFNNEIAKTFKKAAKEAGHEVRLFDLATADFDPVLRYGHAKEMPENEFINSAIESLIWCDKLVVNFPLWWSNIPSILQGFFERAFVLDKIYKVTKEGTIEGQLKGRKAILIVTSGAASDYVLTDEAMAPSVLEKHVFPECGLELEEKLVFGLIDSSTDEERNKYLEEVKELVKRLD
ncbi:MAG: NAD(P)H-dependent oxidoreductase [Tissierellia bacterium]|nr:NAD(P)H-dependent oxidoreductase [Tissierellia bacterium]